MQVRAQFSTPGIPHPPVSIKDQSCIDQLARHLEDLWEQRTAGEHAAVVAIPTERSWRPTQVEDDVLEIADAILDAGGLPRLLYVGAPKKDFDALAIPGGIDVHPKFYGEEIGPGMDPAEPDPTFDEFQIGLIRDAFHSKMPLLGHCRGFQITNVALGGSLIQDIPSEFSPRPGFEAKYGTPVDHRPEASRHDFTQRHHGVQLIVTEPGSRLHQLVGELDSVNTVHHQGVKDLSPHLEVTAWGLDGMVEGFQVKGNPQQQGYQFHPESLRYGDARYQGLYDGLVRDAASWRSQKYLVSE